tara:strand:+ start:37 stop:318 length:282 start_codon:yes stop_codon:yes gene_type:complete
MNQTQYRNEQRKKRIKECGCDPYTEPKFIPKSVFKIKRSPSEELLDIFPPLNLNDLKRAYHKKARIHHPDKNGGEHGKFLLIKQAYDELLMIC